MLQIWELWKRSGALPFLGISLFGMLKSSMWFVCFKNNFPFPEDSPASMICFFHCTSICNRVLAGACFSSSGASELKTKLFLSSNRWHVCYRPKKSMNCEARWWKCYGLGLIASWTGQLIITAGWWCLVINIEKEGHIRLQYFILWLDVQVIYIQDIF